MQEEHVNDNLITIDFRALLKVLWKEKFLIAGITLLFTALGAWYAFTAREEFSSEGKILPELSSGGGSTLGGLANLVGIGGFELGIKNNTDAIRPDLYPDVLQSTPYFLSLLQATVRTRNNDSLRFEDFYHQAIEEGKEPEQKSLSKYPVDISGVIVLNKLTEDRIKDLKDRINGSIDKKSGVITISAKMPDPVVAAEVARFSMDYLTNYVTAYRTEKSKQEVDFLGKKVAAARGEFYEDQAKKARYADQYSAPTIRLKSADVQRERIESEYQMSSALYNELLKKYEEAKIKLQQNTPVFQIMNPPLTPTKKSEPRKAVIVFFFHIFGIFFSLMAAIIRKGNFKLVSES
ncbi:lipopolysaccharide biosynthesis protein [Marinilongibacter aquaticus]|uniref:Wzz/FepE/Etk N-terminal domain-containing protein n=1 Tax=Marinilongibacter aquaticus TaxID=2975157 RepID=UPI0021BD9E6A|nr:Wzz/FepE/Etk N-terminal domain-containing protein [Marinilongibacter aquaticus]UBM57634.1 lipopolysaccharide biosynthesis protein [Marinilongibacter aquaticus]